MAYDKFAAVDSSTLLFPPTVRANLAQVSPNLVINGAFEINQRGFTSTTTSAIYGFDRWKFWTSGGTGTYSAQTFTLGSAPVAGYEAKNFARIVTSGQSGASDETSLYQPIESVRTLAGQTVTVSFWAKAGSGTPKIAVEMSQAFGSGGSPSATVRTYFGQSTISTSWARYSVTAVLPNISGKTIGTAGDDCLTLNLFVSAGSNLNSRTGSLGIQNNTFDIWGVQVEAGDVATPFRRNANSIQGELAACQRYYWRLTPSTAYGRYANGYASTTSVVITTFYPPVTMRTAPTSIEANFIAYSDTDATASAATSAGLNNAGPSAIGVNFGGTFTQFRPYIILANNNLNSNIAFNAEL